jgi:hypothetical protein
MARWARTKSGSFRELPAGAYVNRSDCTLGEPTLAAGGEATSVLSLSLVLRLGWFALALGDKNFQESSAQAPLANATDPTTAAASMMTLFIFIV